MEISAHALCAEDHLPYQGRQFSRKEFERIQNSLDRPFGMWNCKHTIFPIILGVSAPAYDESELARYQSNSSQAVTINGRTMSRYQWSQEQRRIETAVRAQKDIAIAAKAAGDDAARRAAQAKINALQERYAFVSEKAGLNTEYERMTVSGFRPVKTVDELVDTQKYKDAAFESVKLYERHVKKHLAEYGGISEKEYVHRAKKLLQQSASDDILILSRNDGSVAKYRVSTNEFVVGTKDGVIRTAFKPQDGYEYWRKELERNQ